jgi:transcriptional accessory protein Tex/SPT6
MKQSANCVSSNPATSGNSADDHIAREISEKNQISQHVAHRLVALFQQDCTVPFIARYRAGEIGLDDPEKVANCKRTYDEQLLVSLLLVVHTSKIVF